MRNSPSIKNKSVFALVDCNNFFVSCERVFAPHLEQKPVVVLSNNDGCAISRSNEAKALGISMGEPFYQFKHLCEKNNLSVFSSNAKLYSNMSWRVMESLKILCPFIEIYSVDEAFLAIHLMNATNYTAFAFNLKEKIKQWTGIPVSVGIAHTKTLAKIANQLAKKSTGVYSLIDNPKLDEILASFPVEDIWGIGRKLAPKLRMIGIGDAKQLRDSDPQFIRQKFSVMMERIVYELGSISYLEISNLHKDKQSITHSRSFAHPLYAIEELEEALINYVSRASEKLRKQNLRAQSIYISIRTNYFNSKLPQYSNSFAYLLPHPTSDTRELIHYGKKALQTIYQTNYPYHKLAVTLLDLQPAKNEQLQIFNKVNYQHSDQLMQLFDSINKNHGKNSVFLASQKINPSWQMQSKRRSPEYTTNWEELPIVS